ncbi:electron transport complex subunit RsxC [Vibrio sp. HB161653]|uniref:electron transport complex subunit RsxC n=1 Tax=Vibrio sp. HB161653 TaxID=3068274 RepID=UPI00273D2157|nr:electron transport complex subunit RsxC [Vibrio sp. HB161653]MDP5253740.1 electron transport complex subunit RsxC [Vibrio sp. HB161653]
MLSLIEQIKSGALWDFPGGIHPAENKKQSNQLPLSQCPLPAELIIPLKQHIGKAGHILIAPGDQVKKGQALTRATTGFTVPVHASTSGTIQAIEPRTTAHPSALPELCAVLIPDGQDQWLEKQPFQDYRQIEAEKLLDRLRDYGIAGMGGAGFPSAKKLQSGLAKTELLIINAAECEPYITADDRLIQDEAEQIIAGIEIVEHILKPKLTIVGIEDNKPDAIEALQVAAKDKNIVIRVIPTKYPSGGEKQLIKILTNLEVPSRGIPADIGILVQNIGSLYAIKRAIVDGEPLIERVVTLTGKTFKQPRNVWVRIGTPVEHLLQSFEYKADKKLPRLIMGGPMMGFTLPHANVPITKTSNCILAPKKREIAAEQNELECIRCSQCAEACPASLLPQQLQWHAKAQEYEKLEELNLKDCIECGACAFVCPSEIPLVNYYRQAKAEIRTRQQDAEAAERAKERFEAKKARMERDKQERENRFKSAASDRRKSMQKNGDDPVAAAIERVKNKQQSDQPAKVKPAVAAAIAKAKAQQAAAQNAEATPEQNDNKKDAVAAAIARAKARKDAQANPEADKAAPDTTPSSEASEDAKKAAVAAAIARAKARKNAQSTPEADKTESDTTPSSEASEDAKKDAVAAAIARAKARKAAQATPEADKTESDTTPSSEAPEDAKKAAVAAAIARAKARKAAQVTPEADKTESDTTPTSEAPEDPKKAAVAAAIARAKARKAAQATPEADKTESDTTPTSEAPEDPKKAAVAAAIARAKARKAAQATPEADKTESDSTPTSEAPEDPKKAAVAAAIARAKARKAAQSSTDPENK